MGEPTKENKGVRYFLEDVDPRVIYAIIIILMLGVTLRPLGLPIRVSPNTKVFVDYLDNLPENSVVMFFADWGATHEFTIGTQFRPFLIQLARLNAEKGIKWVAASSTPDGLVLFPEKLEEPDVKKAMSNMVYGEDWVYLGYFAGVETGLAALLKGIPNMFTYDAFGNAVVDLPLIQQANKAEDFAVFMGSGGGELGHWIRQIAVAYDKPLAIMTQGICAPSIQPFIPQLVYTMLTDMKCAAEYEYMIGMPGPAISGMDIQTVVHLFLFVMIILANVMYFTKGKQDTGRND